MLSDEEKKAIDKINKLVEYLRKWNENVTIVPADIKYFEKILDMIKTYIRMIDENIEEILEQSKEIEELKEDRKKYAEEYIHNNPWLYKQLNENYILRVESEQRERGAYIKGTNDADELCNKKWEDKIKAKMEELDNPLSETFKSLLNAEEPTWSGTIKQFLQSLLEKE